MFVYRAALHRHNALEVRPNLQNRVPGTEMDWQGWLTLAVVLLALVGMVREVAGPDLIMMAALFTLAAFGSILPARPAFGWPPALDR